MRTRLMRGKFTLLFLTLAMLLAIPAIAFAQDSTVSTSPAPTIQSDQADYAPGATVNLTGSGWQPGEAVHINVNDDVGNTWSRDTDVTADQNGAIQDQFQLPSTFVAVYKVTATGAQSGVATSSFTDGNLTFHGSNTPVNAPASWTVSATVYSGNNTTPNTTCSGSGSTKTTTVLGTSSANLAGGVGANDSVRLGSVTPVNDTSKVFDSWTSGTTDLCGDL